MGYCEMFKFGFIGLTEQIKIGQGDYSSVTRLKGGRHLPSQGKAHRGDPFFSLHKPMKELLSCR